jgi:pyruvate dehydrogenase E2 component (dihydrolipoamide acetyltransferase)
MPSLGAAMEEGTLIEWRRRPGEAVARGEVIAEIETDKGAIEVECFATGVVERLLVEPGTKVPVGTPLAIIREEGEAEAAPPPPEPPAPVRASPMARRRARELGVALEGLRGSGPDGAVSVEDVERAAAPAAAPSPPPADRMRRAIGAAMALSKREIPHFYAGHTIDLTPALDWMEAKNRELPVEERLIPAVLLLRATALALRAAPELVARCEAGVVTRLDAIHLSVIVYLRGGGLVAPALHDVDRTPLAELMREFQDLVERARAGRLRGSELSDGTVTVTSLGDGGVDSVVPVIFPPQVAIVGFGTPRLRPWCVDGVVVPRRLIDATVAIDHRAADGRAASRFLRALEAALARPEEP